MAPPPYKGGVAAASADGVVVSRPDRSVPPILVHVMLDKRFKRAEINRLM
jgi:hypothetical protein